MPGTYAVALAARSEAALLRLHDKLKYHGIQHALVREPDPPYNGAAMALGIPPQARGALRPFLKDLRPCR